MRIATLRYFWLFRTQKQQLEMRSLLDFPQVILDTAPELRAVFDKAQSLKDAKKNTESYVMPPSKVQA